LHYDGSIQAVSDEEIRLNEQLIITDEIRKKTLDLILIFLTAMNKI
jgi:hypothetical protein